MLDESALADKAHDDCLQHARREITGELIVELEEASVEWDSTQLRHVFDQPMVVWRRFGDFEVIVDERSRPVGFIDHANWEGCRWRSLGAEDVLAIAARTSWLSGQLTPVGAVRRGPGGCAELAVRDLLRPEASQLYTVRVNPATRSAISILPAEWPSDGS